MKDRRKPSSASSERNMSFSKRDVIAWGGLVIGALGLLLSLVALYLQSRTDRNVTVVVADRGSSDKYLKIGITYRNAGDTTEVVTDTVLTIVNNDDKTVFYRVNLDPCLEPVILPPDSSIHKSYSINILLFAHAIRGTESDISERLLLEVFTAPERYSPYLTTFTTGTINRDPVTGLITKTDIYTRPRQLKLSGILGAGDYNEIRKLPRPSTCNGGGP